MNEEIRETLKIIKEPITVNCIEYKYFDQENYDKITRVYDNCLWFVNNLEQINLTVENLEKENQELKKQLEEYELSLKISKEVLDLQGQDGNYNYDSYMLGMYNGMEYIIALFEKREPIYKDCKDIDFLEDKNKNQQKEFMEWLESESHRLSGDILLNSSFIEVRTILLKYKEIIGDKE